MATKNIVVSPATVSAIKVDSGMAESHATERASKVKLVVDSLWADGVRFVHIMGDKAKNVEPIGTVRDSIKASITAGFSKGVRDLMGKKVSECTGPARKDPEFKARIDGAESERRQYWMQQPNSIMSYYAKQLQEREGKGKAPVQSMEVRFAKVWVQQLEQLKNTEATLFDLFFVQGELAELIAHAKKVLDADRAKREQAKAARKAKAATKKAA